MFESVFENGEVKSSARNIAENFLLGAGMETFAEFY
jgi:hypothetical protein